MRESRSMAQPREWIVSVLASQVRSGSPSLPTEHLTHLPLLDTGSGLCHTAREWLVERWWLGAGCLPLS